MGNKGPSIDELKVGSDPEKKKKKKLSCRHLWQVVDNEIEDNMIDYEIHIRDIHILTTKFFC